MVQLKMKEEGNKKETKRLKITKGLDIIRRKQEKLFYAICNMQGPKILQGVSSRYEDTLQTNGDILIHVLYIVSPTGSEERLCKRQSPKAA